MKVCGIEVPTNILEIIVRQRKWNWRGRTWSEDPEDSESLSRVPSREA